MWTLKSSTEAKMFYGKKNKNFIRMDDSTYASLREFFFDTQKMQKRSEVAKGGEFNFVSHVLNVRGQKRICSIFTEPSTRTQGLCRTAAVSMGGDVYEIVDPQFSSSIKKGESYEDTIRVHAMSGTDLFILRYEGEDADICKKIADMFDEEAGILHYRSSIVCAGVNDIRHPLQALCDGYTFFIHKGKQFLDGDLWYVIVGDLAGSRTIHDLMYVIAIFGARGVILVSEKDNNLPPWCEDLLFFAGIPTYKTDDLLSVAERGDVFYFTRLQKERRKNGKEIAAEEELYYAYKFGTTDPFLRTAPPHAIFHHPLPHGKEIPAKIHLLDQRFVHWRAIRYSEYTKKTQLWKMLNPDYPLGY